MTQPHPEPFAETINDGADRPAQDDGDLNNMGKSLLNILASIIATIANRAWRKFLRKPDTRTQLRALMIDLVRTDEDFRREILAIIGERPARQVMVPHTHTLPRSYDTRFNWWLAVLGGVVGAVGGFLFNLWLDATSVTFGGVKLSDLVDNVVVQGIFYAVFIFVPFMLMGAIGRRQQTSVAQGMSTTSITHFQ